MATIVNTEMAAAALKSCGYGVHDSPYGTFILLERMRGVSHKVCMAQSGYSKSCFLDSMRFLGNDFARIQSVRFPSFGNILADAEIEPAGLRNFSDRFRSVIEMRLERCNQKGVLSPVESLELAAFFDEKLEALRPHFDAAVSPPVLVFTDMHAENFFTDARGVPTAYFDLESAQAAPAALEFYGFRFFLFNFYDAPCFREAEDAFFRGYREAGGLYAPRNRTDDEAIDFLAACRLLELAQSYWAYVDGIRDGWGEAMKHLLFQYVESGSVDYNALGAIWRQRDGQPERPRKP